MPLSSLPTICIVLDPCRHPLGPHRWLVYGSFPFPMFSLHHYLNLNREYPFIESALIRHQHCHQSQCWTLAMQVKTMNAFYLNFSQKQSIRLGLGCRQYFEGNLNKHKQRGGGSEIRNLCHLFMVNPCCGRLGLIPAGDTWKDNAEHTSRTVQVRVEEVSVSWPSRFVHNNVP